MNKQDDQLKEFDLLIGVFLEIGIHTMNHQYDNTKICL